MFQVSDKVVCVDDSPGRSCREKHLVLGMIYVIEGFNDKGPNDFGLWLTGQPKPWLATRFRKLSDIKAENALKNKQTEPVKVNR